MGFKKQAKVEKIAVLAPYEHKMIDEETSTDVASTKQAKTKDKKSLLKRLDNRKKSA